MGSVVRTVCSVWPAVENTAALQQCSSVDIVWWSQSVTDMDTDTNNTNTVHQTLSHHQQERMMSSTVWIVLFSLLMIFSIVANLFYIVSLILSKRVVTMTHILLSFFFMINVVEYVTLILDWRHAEHTDTMLCSWYMFSSHVTLLSTTLTILYFIYYPVESKQVVKVCLVCVLSVVVISVSVSSPTLITSHLDTGDTGACTLTLSSRPVINNTLLLLYNSV